MSFKQAYASINGAHFRFFIATGKEERNNEKLCQSLLIMPAYLGFTSSINPQLSILASLLSTRVAFNSSSTPTTLVT
ncbi:hypothetical protein M1D72_11225 [Vibrio sp. AK197]|uniref:Uncharacterized protein n=1 Tax=Vibrio olivae TaxID=1243002 RepID=A0ABV5HKW7_9VIBR